MMSTVPKRNFRTRSAITPEKKVLAACKQWLAMHGMQPIRNNTGSFAMPYTNAAGASGINYMRTGKTGSGDLLVCCPNGRWCEVEAKSSIGKQSDEQIARQRHVEAMGGIYILARSVDDLQARRGEMGIK